MENHSYKVISDINQMDVGAFIFDWRVISQMPATITVGAYVGDTLAGLVTFERKGDGYYHNFVYDLEIVEAYQGQRLAGELLALVMIDSFNQGYDGYVNLTTKTNGVERFYDALGALRFGNWVTFETAQSQDVINKYLPNGGYVDGL